MFLIHSSPDRNALPDDGGARRMADRVCRRVSACVADEFGLALGELTAPTRRAPHVAFARQVAMYLAHVGFALSLAAVGRAFGRDRTTAAHACRVVEDRRDDVVLDRRLARLEAACRAAMDSTAAVQGGAR